MVKDFSKEVEEAIDWTAAMYKFLRKLHLKLQKVERNKKLSKEKKELKRAIHIAKFINRAKRKAGKDIIDILSFLENIEDKDIQRIFQEIEIPEKKLLKGSSRYVGSLRKGLKHLLKIVKKEMRHPKDIEKLKISFAKEERELEQELTGLERWTGSLVVGLKELDRRAIAEERKLIMQTGRREFLVKTGKGLATAAGAAVALSPLGKALAGRKGKRKVRETEKEKKKRLEGEKVLLLVSLTGDLAKIQHLLPKNLETAFKDIKKKLCIFVASEWEHHKKIIQKGKLSAKKFNEEVLLNWHLGKVSSPAIDYDQDIIKNYLKKYKFNEGKNKVIIISSDAEVYDIQPSILAKGILNWYKELVAQETKKHADTYAIEVISYSGSEHYLKKHVDKDKYYYVDVKDVGKTVRKILLR